MNCGGIGINASSGSGRRHPTDDTGKETAVFRPEVLDAVAKFRQEQLYGTMRQEPAAHLEPKRLERSQREIRSDV